MTTESAHDPPSPQDYARKLRAARWLWVPLAAFLVTRLGIAAVAYFSSPILADSDIPPYHLRPENILLDVFGSRWDTGFYLSIAQDGYRFQGVELPSVAFFPLLPLLIRAFTWLLGDPLLAGVVIANLALFSASVFLYLLAAREWGGAVAGRAVWYLLVFPTSFFGSAIYSESLFLLAAVLALYLARQRLWGGAALAGMLAALSRLTGLLVAPLLLGEWWLQRRDSSGRASLAGLFAALAVPLGTGAYMLYLNLAFGDPLAFLHGSAAWGRVLRSPWVTVAELIQAPPGGWASALAAGQLPLDNWLDLGFVLFFLVLGVVLLTQRRWGEGFFVTFGALLPLSTALLMSQRRYVWVLFPTYILLARWGGNPLVDRVILVLSAIGLGLFTALFANWYWVG
jgi:hypothetical protein